MTENTKQGRRTVELRSFQLLDVDENYEPPERPHLHVALIGDLLSLELQTESYDAKTKTTTVTCVAGIVVDVEPFYNGLRASLISRGEKFR